MMSSTFIRMLCLDTLIIIIIIIIIIIRLNGDSIVSTFVRV